MTDRFLVQVWYSDVIEDLSKLPDAIAYYETVLRDGEKYLVPKGNLENLLIAQAGTVYFYECAHDDAAKISKWIDEKIIHEKGKLYRWFQSKEGKDQYGDLKSTDIKAYTDADNSIYELVEFSNYIDSAKMSLSSLVERLRERGIYLSMVAKLRAAGQAEIMIDASEETPLYD